MQNPVQVLRRISIFSRLETSDLTQLAPYIAVQAYDRGSIIFHEADPLPARLFAVLSGTIEIKKTASTGKETIFRVLTGGEIFAAIALFGNGIAPVTVVAAQNCQIVTIEREGLLNLMRQNPEVAFAMIAVLNDRIQTLHDVLHSIVSERAIVRLAQLLLKTAEKDHRDGQPLTEGRLQTCLSYYQIARTIGITYEECVRLFKQLSTIVQYQRGHITILDLAQLTHLAQGQDAHARSESSRQRDVTAGLP